jgi:hypothetical protein
VLRPLSFLQLGWWGAFGGEKQRITTYSASSPVLGHHPTPSGFSPYSAGSKLAAGWTGSSSLGVGRRECSREATSLTLTLSAQPALSANAQSPMRGAVQQYIYFGIKRIAQNSLYFAPPMAAGASSPSSTSGKRKTQTADPFLCCSVVPRPFSPIGSHACVPVLAHGSRPNQATRSSRGPTPGTPTCARRRATTRLCTSHPLVLTSDRHSASALSGLPLDESVSALGSARRLRGASRVGWQKHALTLPPTFLLGLAQPQGGRRGGCRPCRQEVNQSESCRGTDWENGLASACRVPRTTPPSSRRSRARRRTTRLAWGRLEVEKEITCAQTCFRRKGRQAVRVSRCIWTCARPPRGPSAKATQSLSRPSPPLLAERQL